MFGYAIEITILSILSSTCKAVLIYAIVPSQGCIFLDMKF